MPNRTVAFKRAIAKIKRGAFLIFQKFVDTATASDQLTWDMGKNVADSATVTDTPTLSVTKPIADAASVTDAIALVTVKNVTEALSVGDVTTLSASKPFSDTIGATDSGLVVAQDYCDITYFQQDFVGESSTI